MKIIYCREGANFESKGPMAQFHGVAAVEFLNIRRTAPLGIPRTEIMLKADAIYKVYTGLKFDYANPMENVAADLPDVRVVADRFKESGTQVVRVDVEKGELVVFVRSMIEFELNRSQHLFESTALHGVEIGTVSGVSAMTRDGFVAPAAQQVVDDAKKVAQTTQEDPDAEQAKNDAFWNSEDPRAGKQHAVQGGAPLAVAVPMSDRIKPVVEAPADH